MSIVRETYIIGRKEMMIWIKNPMLPIVRAIVFPMMWIIIFGSAFSGTIKDIPVALVQEDFGAYAQEYVGMLNSQGKLDITTTTNYATANKLLVDGKVYGVIFIPPDFSESLSKNAKPKVQLSIDETKPQVSTGLISFFSEVTSAFSKKVTNEKESIEVQKNTLFGREIEYLDFLAPGVIMMTVVFSAIFSGGLGLIMDREFGTLTMLMAAPISRNAIILGKIFAGVAQSIASGIVALLAALLMGVHIKTGFLGFLIMMVLTVVAAFGFIGMSTVLGTRIKQMEQFMVVMQVIIMPMWFLSGGLYPLESMPVWMKPLAIIDPLTYATDAMRAVMIRGIIWSTLALDVGILMAFAVSMFIAGSLSFKRVIL